MTAYIIKRVLAILPTLFFVLAISFFAVRFIPGDPASVLLGDMATTQQVERLKAELGLDRPVLVQFGKYIVRVFQGDFGQSIIYHLPVGRLIWSRTETTASLAVFTMVIILCLGLPAGVLAAVKPNTLLDQSFLVIVLCGASFPTFWFGLLVMMAFAVALRWFPTSGFVSILGTGNLANLRYLVLPAVTLGFSNSALLARMTRASMLEVLGEDYVSTARSKGLRERTVVLKHAFRNAAIPILTIVLFTFAGLLAGTAITETVFALPGIGLLLVQSVMQRDYPCIQAVMVVVAFLYLFISLVTDITYALLDPRIHYGE